MMERFRGDDTRVAVIGLDGVPFELLTDHPARFEHVHSLMADGGGAEAAGVLPAASSVTWPSITAGVNPGETGVYGLIDRHVGSYETYVTAADDIQAPRLWDRAVAAGRRATAINVPVTYPPQRNLTRMVADYQAPDVQRASYPRAVAGALESLDYRLDVNAALGRSNLGAFLEDAYETLDARYEAFVHFLERDDWDLFVGVFTTPDRVNHFLYGDYSTDGPLRDDFLAFYEQLDTYLGAIRSHLPDDAHLAVVSDHGFTQLEYDVQVNAWLEREGWLSLAERDPDRLGDIAEDSRAFSLEPGRIYLNLEGREPRGQVPQAEYELVRDRLREALLAWTGPDGRPVASEVLTREERYRGPHVDLAPDLVIVPTDGFDLHSRFSRGSTVFERTERTGMHIDRGSAIMIDTPAVTLDDPSIYDVAPTVMDLLDIPVESADFDGTSLVI